MYCHLSGENLSANIENTGESLCWQSDLSVNVCVCVRECECVRGCANSVFCQTLFATRDLSLMRLA